MSHPLYNFFWNSFLWLCRMELRNSQMILRTPHCFFFCLPSEIKSAYCVNLCRTSSIHSISGLLLLWSLSNIFFIFSLSFALYMVLLTLFLLFKWKSPCNNSRRSLRGCWTHAHACENKFLFIRNFNRSQKKIFFEWTRSHFDI